MAVEYLNRTPPDTRTSRYSDERKAPIGYTQAEWDAENDNWEGEETA